MRIAIAPASSTPATSWSRLRARIGSVPTLFLTLAIAGSAAACGEDDGGPTGTGGPVVGTYVSSETGQYVVVTNTNVTVYDPTAVCYDVTDYRIASRSDDRFTLVQGEDTIEVDIIRTEDGLRVSLSGSSADYDESGVDVATLNVCGGDDDIAQLPACATLPALAIGSGVEGRLSSSDPTFTNGAHYDAYRIDATGSSNVSIALATNEFDPFLYLFEDTGRLIALNDDDAEAGGLDSRLEATLDEGCYIVVASSFGPEETGNYDLAAASL